MIQLKVSANGAVSTVGAATCRLVANYAKEALPAQVGLLPPPMKPSLPVWVLPHSLLRLNSADNAPTPRNVPHVRQPRRLHALPAPQSTLCLVGLA